MDVNKYIAFVVTALMFQAYYAGDVVGAVQEEVTDEMVEIIEKLDLLENFEMLGEDLVLLEEYEDIEKSDDSELLGGEDD